MKWFDLDTTDRVNRMCEMENVHAAMLVGSDDNGHAIVAMPRNVRYSQYALRWLGFTIVDMYYFPLGSDRPPAEYRHDSAHYANIPSCNWLYAVCEVS